MSSAQLKKFASVKPADIEWRDGLPYSREFDDVYFSIHGAIEESQYVFVEGNQLASDWKNRQQSQFYIAELGFGSGLNFLNTAKNWQSHLLSQSTNTKSSEQSQQLHYLAIEKHPFTLSNLKKACRCWPELSEIGELLIDNYPSQSYGRHQLTFHDLNITLTLFFMPLQDAFDDLLKESSSQQNKINIDHWFLDGFAPTKNPSMWGDKNARSIASLSRPGSKLATYTVAGSVKKALAGVGFKIQKRKGFSKKREMLTAILNKEKAAPFTTTSVNIKYETPWFNICKTALVNDVSKANKTSITDSSYRIAIIGGGIAGCTTAYSLTLKGYQCDLFESNDDIAKGASGAAAGIFHPQLTADMNLSSQFSWLSYLRIIRFISQLNDKEKQMLLINRGVYRFFDNQDSVDQLLDLSEQLRLSDWIKTIDNKFQNDHCIYYPDSAAIDIQALCKLLLRKIPKGKLNVYAGKEVLDISRANQHEALWNIIRKEDEHNPNQYQQVIFCGGANSSLLKKLNITATNTTRGQTCFIQSEQLAKEVKQVLCEQVYLVPNKDDKFQLGSTFEDFTEDKLSSSSQIDLLNRTSNFLRRVGLSGLEQNLIDNAPLTGTVGYRLHSMDRLPIVGGVVDSRKMIDAFSNLGQKRLSRSDIGYYNIPGLWINTAYGSHGLLHSLLASEHLASLISNETSPLSSNISDALHPARFMLRDLKRNKIS